MYAYIRETVGGFFAGVCEQDDRLLTFGNPPPTLPFANGSVPAHGVQ